MRKIVLTIIVFLIMLFLYGRYIEPNNIKVKEIIISNTPISTSFGELKFLHFSDLLYDGNQKKLEKIKNTINDLKPDIIFFTGDLFNNKITYNDDDFNNIKDFLENIDAELYKFAIIGENDINRLDKYKDILYESNFILLDNSNFLLFYKDNTPINIIGLNTNYDIEELLNSDIPYNYSIVLVHKPDEITNINIDKINLVLSGHSLGGIINIPYYGGLIKKDGANTYINNYYKVKNTDLYVSNGIGYDNFAFRLFNTPSISVFRFTK